MQKNKNSNRILQKKTQFSQKIETPEVILMEKIWPHSTQFGLGFFSVCYFNFVVFGAVRQLVVFCLLVYECALGGQHEKVILKMQRNLGENI